MIYPKLERFERTSSVIDGLSHQRPFFGRGFICPLENCLSAGVSLFSKLCVRIHEHHFKTSEEIEKMRLACRLAAEVLDYITPFVKPGVTTEALDKLVTTTWSTCRVVFRPR